MMDNPEKEIQQDEKSQEILSKNEQKPMQKKKKTFFLILIIFAVLVCVAAATIVLVFKVIIPNQDYKAAVALMESGDYEAAISAFEAMNGYKDSLSQIDSCKTAMEESQNTSVAAEESSETEDDSSNEKDEYQRSNVSNEEAYADLTRERIKSFSSVSIGDTVLFGSYEQDNNTANGQEDIEWLVLDKTVSRILVISQRALDCQQYNTSYNEILCPDATWSSCSLRTWLNSTFLETAFTEMEQLYIPTVTVTAEMNPNYDTAAGNDTQDQIFLLSISEAEEYFTSDAERQCKVTAYARAQGAYVSESGGYCWWWLRSPGPYSNIAANVNRDGTVFSFGNYVTIKDCCVRPAIWINLGS